MNSTGFQAFYLPLENRGCHSDAEILVENNNGDNDEPSSG